jgi:hypothetical protein
MKTSVKVTFFLAIAAAMVGETKTEAIRRAPG